MDDAPEHGEADQARIRLLEARIASLEDENEALAEGHEDALLLGLVAEQIQGEHGTQRILRAGLERISLLKDLPLCACLELRGKQALVVQHYCSLTDAAAAAEPLVLSERVADGLTRASSLLIGPECAEAGLDGVHPVAFAPAAVLLIPFKARALPSGAFLFADDRGEERLQRGLTFLHRLCEALVARLDNDALLRELRQLNADLDAKVRARTDDLVTRNEELQRENAERLRAEAELRQSQKLESIGRLAGGVAHDFNNILTTILGTAELALERLRPGDPLQEDLAVIRDAGTRAAGLTSQLLAFSRRQRLDTKVVMLGDVCQAFTRMLRRVIGEDVTLHITDVPGTSPVLVDVGQIEQVVLNLVVNARDAMPRGGRLDIRVKPSAEGREVALEVEDAGVGIPPNLIDRVFEPFFTTKPAGKGTGLGLATAYGIVRQHGGRIAVRSVVNGGTLFTVTLPAAAPHTTLSPGHSDTAPVRGTEAVLVVDDDVTVREVVRAGLERLGYAATAADAGEALASLRSAGADFDVLVTDVVMPGASGPEVARAFLARFPAGGVVFMSGTRASAWSFHPRRSSSRSRWRPERSPPPCATP